MAHFAELNQNNIVKQVIVVSNFDTSDNNGVETESIGIAFCQKLFGSHTKWKQTSYNGNIRKRHAGIGMLYHQEIDAFVIQQPYPSWTLNTETAEWEAPVAYPETETETYQWNEENQTWDLLEDQ